MKEVKRMQFNVGDAVKFKDMEIVDVWEIKVDGETIYGVSSQKVIDAQTSGNPIIVKSLDPGDPRDVLVECKSVPVSFWISSKMLSTEQTIDW